MPRSSPVPVFSDKSHSAHNRSMLHLELTIRKHTAAELLGVLAFNALSSDSSDLLGDPIAIDPFDQRRLADMRLVRQASRSTNPEINLPTSELTDFGRFVVASVVFIDDEIGDGTLPIADIPALLRALT